MHMYSFSGGSEVLLPQQMLSDTDLTSSLIADMRCLGGHLGHVVDEVDYTLTVPPLIVIPGHQLHTRTASW